MGVEILAAKVSASKTRSVGRSDQERFESTMAMAFIADPIIRWGWPDPLQYARTFIPFLSAFGGKSFDHGSAYVIGDFFGVVQWLPPGVQPDDAPIMEYFEKFGREPRRSEVLSLMEQMGNSHPEEPHWYLPLIGIDPVHQRRGLGTELMQQGLAVCDRDRQPVYLEATSPASRDFYERLGFRTLKELRSADSPPMFPMLREPR